MINWIVNWRSCAALIPLYNSNGQTISSIAVRETPPTDRVPQLVNQTHFHNNSRVWATVYRSLPGVHRCRYDLIHINSDYQISPPAKNGNSIGVPPCNLFSIRYAFPSRGMRVLRVWQTLGDDSVIDSRSRWTKQIILSILLSTLVRLDVSNESKLNNFKYSIFLIHRLIDLNLLNKMFINYLNY